MYLPIESERLLLREIVESDWKEMHTYLSDPEVQEYMMFNLTNEEQSQSYVQRFLKFQKDEPRGYVKFVIVLKENDTIVGEVGVNMPNFEHKNGELVYRLKKDNWGKGYATEAAKTMIEFGFKQLKLHRIDAFCDIRNTSSCRVLEKVGMLREGCLREHRWIKGRWRSSYIYSVLEEGYWLRQ